MSTCRYCDKIQQKIKQDCGDGFCTLVHTQNITCYFFAVRKLSECHNKNNHGFFVYYLYYK